MRCSRLAVPFFAFSLMGCAAVFRDHKPNVHFEADQPGAEVRIRNEAPRPMPADVDVDRSATTSVVVSKPGFSDNRGVVAKKMNGGWVALDVITCVFPIALCIPLLVDAISGAWLDVEKSYHVKLEPLAGGATPIGTIAAITPPPVLPATPPASPAAQMSESERKATARAAYLEAVAMQEKSNCAEALPRFEAAERLFDAPTHLLHIAQCQVSVGKLVEANETYETLTRVSLAANAPDAFRQAQESAKHELPALKPRIPTLRIMIAPPPSSLPGVSVQVNGHAMPVELVGIARPVNPGNYKITAGAGGFKPATVEVSLREGELKTADVRLTR